jgi:hypothetical protein
MGTKSPSKKKICPWVRRGSVENLLGVDEKRVVRGEKLVRTARSVEMGAMSVKTWLDTTEIVRSQTQN